MQPIFIWEVHKPSCDWSTQVLQHSKEKNKGKETALPTHSFPKQKLPASATQAKCNFCTKNFYFSSKEPTPVLWHAFFQVFVLTTQAKGYYRVNFIINVIFKKGHRGGRWQSIKEHQKVMITWLHIAVLKRRTSWRSSILITSWRISW